MTFVGLVEADNVLEASLLSQRDFSPLLVTLDISNQNWKKSIAGIRQDLLELLWENGAILFRGEMFNAFPKVDQFAELIFDELLMFNAEHRPISKDSNVQRPVEYSQSDFLLWHNENTFNFDFPSKAIFACEKPAQRGGQTPIVDSRSVYNSIRKEIRDEFISKQLMYVRTYRRRDFIGLGWETVFQTSDKKDVERKCSEMKISFEWRDSDILRTRAIRPAFYTHPHNGTACWINQAQHWHVSCLSESVKSGFEICIKNVEDYPRNCLFGDGSIIPNDYMEHILDVYKEHAFQFDWQEGDLLLVDNVLKAHARKAYEGERRIMVCFGDPITF